MTTPIEDDGLRAIALIIDPHAFMEDRVHPLEPPFDDMVRQDRELALSKARRIAALRSSPAVDGVGEPVGTFWRWASDDKWRMLGKVSEAARADFVRDQEKIAPIVVADLYTPSALSPTSDRASVVEACAKVITDLADEWKRRGGLPSSEGEWPAYMAKAVRRLALSKEGSES